MFPGTAASIEHIKAGRLRPLAVTATTRLQVLPDIAPMNEFVPGSNELPQRYRRAQKHACRGHREYE